MAIAIAMTLLGIASLSRLAIEQYPDITPPVVQVSASYVGADAVTVNNSVAVPIAEQVMGTSDMLYMQTTSANDGTMAMQIIFDVGSSPDIDAISTQNNVSAATSSLPEAVVQQGVLTRKSDTGFLMVYALQSDGRYDDEFLSNYAQINLENRIEKINGVGKVAIMGAGEYAMRIWIDPARLHYYGLSLQQVLDAISTQSAIYPAGRFGAEPSTDDAVYTYTVTLPPQITTPEEFSSIIIALDENGGEIRLGNIAEVQLGSQSYNVRSQINGDPSTLIVIYQEPGSNAVEVGSRVKALISEMEERFPDGVTIHTIVDSTRSIKAGISDIFRTLIIALVLVIAIIFLFLQDWRSTIIPLVAIPVSIVGTFAVFPLLGFSINIISLLALVLAIGLVVDDAIVVVEAVKVNLEHGMEPREATREAMRRVSSPIIATTVVLLAVFIPVSLMEGIVGLLFRQFSITISTAIAFSAFNALTLSPALCSILLRREEHKRKGLFARFNSWLERSFSHYGEFTARLLPHVARTAIFVAATFVLIFISWRALPAGFLPDEDQGYLMVFVSTPEASSLTTTTAAMQHIEQVIATHPEVEFTALAAGFNLMAGVSSTSSGVIFVVLKDSHQRKLSASELSTLLTEKLYAAVPEADSYAFVPPAIPGLGVTSGTSYLLQQTERLMDSLRQSPSIASITTQFRADVPQRRIDIDKRQAMIEGVALADIYSSLSTYLGGSYIGNFNRFGRLYQSYIQAAPDDRLNARSIDSYFVTNASAESVPISALVNVRDTVGVEYITQFNLYQSISLTATPSAKASTGDAMKAITTVANRILPDDIGYEWSGMAYQQANAARGQGAIYLLVLAFVFLALSALYNSWSLPMAILMSVPVAVLGAVVTMAIAHHADANLVNDVYMRISLIMLIGLAAKNAILVVEYADQKFFSSDSISLSEAALSAANERLRPIIMTALAFILGVMPLVFASGEYSTARNIMGVALVGGMLAATFIGIFLYPATYYMVGLFARFEERRRNKTK